MRTQESQPTKAASRVHLDEEKIREHDELCEKQKKILRAVGITGPWESEPNRMNWKHAGLQCMAVRATSMLHWCGYVGVPREHKAYGQDYDAIQGSYKLNTLTGQYEDSEPLFDINVHGGLTYANKCAGHVCHIPEPGDPDDVWWLGFDCAHYMDLSPGLLQYTDKIGRFRDTYRDLNFVKRECERLAEDLVR